MQDCVMTHPGAAPQALERQEPFVNPTLANHALALLARLFRYGRISSQGGFGTLAATARVQALAIDPEYWKTLRRRHAGLTARAVPHYSSGLRRFWSR